MQWADNRSIKLALLSYLSTDGYLPWHATARRVQDTRGSRQALSDKKN